MSWSLIGAGVALLAALAAAVLTRRGLRPLRRLAAAAGEIERTADPSRRLRLPERRRRRRDRAARPGCLNRMLASLEAARAGERRFLADASHELRTPVTTLLGNVEFAARHGADPEVLEELSATPAGWRGWSTICWRSSGPAARARRARSRSTWRWWSRGRRCARRGRGRVGPAGGGRAFVRGDASELARAVENLVENALVHGPADGLGDGLGRRVADGSRAR